MATPVIMPRQGQSVESCIIVGWKKRKGDQVKAGDILCEVETDKATFEVESPAEGTLLEIFAEQGADVPVLAPIAAIGALGENIDSLRPGGAPAATSAPAASPSTPAAAPAAPVAASAPAVAPVPAGKIKASPRARALAASRGVDLAGLRGTGPGGRIIERDVAAAAPTGAASQRQAAVSRPAAAVIAPALPAATGEVREVKVSGIRRLIAERMLASLQTTAQLTMHTATDARTLQSMRRRFKESPEALGLREVTINDMVLYAVSRALTQFPDMNALFSGDTMQVHGSVNLGFAVDTPRGLMVPVIRNAQALSLRDLSREAARLIAGCRDGGITPDEMAGGTFTVSNLGTFGIHGFTPVLNAPQVGILGVGAIVPGPVMENDAVAFVPQIALSLTINHQVVDGAPGARFLQALAADIGRFDLLLAR
ncbi:MAG TPA: dihydrolipoamide acetyltransferase family protein [Spirochaetia bacterium]|nr:dihydrolipoamide acetyltransferase family protein [Spirochaetia bacterium]